MPSFPYSNPLLAMGNPLLNPLMINPSTAALATFASAAVTPHSSPAAALSTLAAVSSAMTTSVAPVARQSPAVQVSHSPKANFLQSNDFICIHVSSYFQSFGLKIVISLL